MGTRDDELRVELDGGKYTVIFNWETGLRALRYGEEWRSLTGDKLVLAMAFEIDRLRREYEDEQNS